MTKEEILKVLEEEEAGFVYDDVGALVTDGEVEQADFPVAHTFSVLDTEGLFFVSFEPLESEDQIDEIKKSFGLYRGQ